MCQHFGRKALEARRSRSIIAYNPGLVPIYRAVELGLEGEP